MIYFCTSSEVVYVHVKQLDQQVLFKVTNNEDEKNQDSRKYKNKVKELAEFDLLLATNYLKMHNAKHWYYNEEGKSAHIFEMPLKYKEKKNKKDEKIKGIYGVIADGKSINTSADGSVTRFIAEKDTEYMLIPERK